MSTSTTPAASAAPATPTGTDSKGSPSASLYVGEIAPDVTEGILFEIFNNVGPVASIRVCRDTITRRSLGYAYVNFHSVEDADRALDTLNNISIKGRPCRIMWSQRDPSIRKSGVGNIFIKNLDPEIGHKELHDTFSAFGNILSCKVATDSEGNSRGFGFVHFESAEAAESAIQMVNDMMLGSKRVYVNHFKPRKEREAEKEASWTNVYVKDLDLEVTQEELDTAFGEHGNITSSTIMFDEDGKSKGFAFVNFASHPEAAAAVEAMNGVEMKGKKLYAGRAQKKAEREEELRKKFEQIKQDRLRKYQGINLYVKNLEDDIDEERLRNEFAPFGEIKSIKIMMDERGVSKGFGFVCYSAPEEAQTAITEMNSRILQGSSKPLYVALHEPKEMRRHKLAARHAATRGGKGAAGRGMGGMPQMFAGNQPVYYGQPAGPGGFMYPQQMMRQQRGWGQQSYPVNNYMMSMQGGQQQQGGQAQQPAQQRAAPAKTPELTVQYLESLPAERAKVFLGERLYHLIEKTKPQLAGKITGMFLDSGWSYQELISLTTNDEKLQEKIEEAVVVLDNARAKDVPAEQ